jgi:hypothetical protein
MQGGLFMKQTKNLIGIWGKTTKTLAVLASFVLLSLTFSSCKNCGKNNKGGDPGNRNTPSQTSSGDGSSNGGNPSQAVIPRDTKAPTLDDLQNKINSVLDGVLNPVDVMNMYNIFHGSINMNTPNMFIKAFLKARGASNVDTNKTHEWLNRIYAVYRNRVRWACCLYQEYNNGAQRDDRFKQEADRALDAKKRGETTEIWVRHRNLNVYQEAAEEIKTLKENKTNMGLVNDWNALYDNDSKLMRDADEQWDELVKIVDAYRAAHP